MSKTLTKYIHCLLLSCIAILSSCDSMQYDDVAPDEFEHFYFLGADYIDMRSGSYAVIDPLQNDIINSSTQVNIIDDAQKGSIYIEENGLVTYIANEDFISGIDSFHYIIEHPNDTSLNQYGTIVINATSHSFDTLKCDYAAWFDYYATTDTTITMDVLSNDIFCDGVDLNSLEIEIAPSYGSYYIQNNKIFYTPNSGAYGCDYLIYSCRENSCNDKKYGYVKIDIDTEPSWVDPLSLNCDELQAHQDSYYFNGEADALSGEGQIYIDLDVLSNDNLCTNGLGEVIYPVIEILTEPSFGNVNVQSVVNFTGQTYYYIGYLPVAGAPEETYTYLDYRIIYPDGTYSDATINITY